MKIPANLIASAVSNHEKTKQVVSLLAPKKEEAKTRAQEMRGELDRAKQIGGRVRFVRSMHYAPGFFPTPPALVSRLIEEANLSPGLSCLEPEAGTGNIARAIVAAGCSCRCIELVTAMAETLRAEGFKVDNQDFLTVEPSELFDRVLMNPPFEKRQDEAHVKHAHRFLVTGGKLVAIVSSMTGIRLTEWAEANGGFVEMLPQGSFKNSERSTGVSVSLVVAYK